MGGGFACARCDQLYQERPGTCYECGSGAVEPLTFSEYRARRRADEALWTEQSPDRRGHRGVLVALALLLVVLGLVAVGIGVTTL